MKSLDKKIFILAAAFCLTVGFQNCAPASFTDETHLSAQPQLGHPEDVDCDFTQSPAGDVCVLTFKGSEGQGTLAFEDIYPTPLDSDYNDFVTNIGVKEFYSKSGELVQIVIDYVPKNIGGGLPHKLVAVFDGIVRGRDGWVSNQNKFVSPPMFNGNAVIRYDLYYSGQLAVSRIVPKAADLIVFESTSQAVRNAITARITITGFDGKQNLLKDRRAVSIKRYRNLLYVPDAGTYSTVKRYDIDISDINPMAYDESGRPLAFFVPANWRVPKSGVNIAYAYPDFQLHADYVRGSAVNPQSLESEQSANWFSNVVLNYVD